MFALTSQSHDYSLWTYNNTSLLIAKSGIPYTIGEQLILPAIEEILKAALHTPPFDVLKKVLLVTTLYKDVLMK